MHALYGVHARPGNFLRILPLNYPHAAGHEEPDSNRQPRVLYCVPRATTVIRTRGLRRTRTTLFHLSYSGMNLTAPTVIDPVPRSWYPHNVNAVRSRWGCWTRTNMTTAKQSRPAIERIPMEPPPGASPGLPSLQGTAGRWTQRLVFLLVPVLHSRLAVQGIPG